MKRVFGIIGYPLGHSLSARYFADKFEAEGITDAAYEKFPLRDIAQLTTLVGDYEELCGLNVTIPYKERVIPYLSALTPEAREIGAVNCIRVEDGRLTGHNTDAPAFRDTLLGLLGTARPAALLLGTGGASKAVAQALRSIGIDYLTVSRKAAPGVTTYGEVDAKTIAARPLIVNTTPLGTFPHVDQCPDLPYGQITMDHYLYDLVYNPPLTEFLRRGREQGAKIMNGYAMFAAQAELSWQIWNR